MQHGRRGFTLIELLVCVGIIAILAAIALPNFLEAQTRAKYSRVLGDLRAMSVAAEAYAVDNNRVPRMTWGSAPYNDRYTGHGVVDEPIFGTFGPWVTTPVAYMVKYDDLDHFVGQRQSLRLDARIYTYHDLPTHQSISKLPGRDPLFPGKFQREFGMAAYMSLGPDGKEGVQNGGPNAFWIQYDPTNGTVSAGNIWRSQKSSDNRYYDLVS